MQFGFPASSAHAHVSYRMPPPVSAAYLVLATETCQAHHVMDCPVTRVRTAVELGKGRGCCMRYCGVKFYIIDAAVLSSSLCVLIDMSLTFSSITPLYGLLGLIFIEVVHTRVFSFSGRVAQSACGLLPEVPRKWACLASDYGRCEGSQHSLLLKINVA